MRQTPLSKETSKVSLVSQSKMTSFSKELFNTWRDIRWFQIPLSSLRRPKAGLFSFTFQSSLQKYQQLRKTKRLKVGRPFSVLPFPSLSLPFTDPPSFPDALQGDNHRSSRNDRSKVRKRLSAHRNESRDFLRRMQKKLQKHQPSPEVLHPKRFCSAAVSGQQWVTGLGRRPRKKSKKGDPAPPAETPGRGEGSCERSDSKSPLEEDEDIFPPDWSPPSFLFKEEPPSPPSPGPGPLSEPGSSQETPDGPEGLESTKELEQEDAAPPADALGRDEGCRGRSSPRSPLKEDAGMFLPDWPLRQIAFLYNDESPPLSPVPGPSEPRSSQEAADVTEEAGGSPRVEGPSSSPPLHLLLPPSGNSSRSSPSASSEEVLGDPGGFMVDSDEEEEDMDDSSLVPLRDLLHMEESSSSSVDMSMCPSPRPESYLNSLDKLLEEKREQIREDRELERSLGSKLLFSKWSTAGESSEENDASLLDTQRLVLEQFSISAGSIPTVHPGEHIFRPPPYPRSAFVLDTAGLAPQNRLESLLFSSSSSTSQQLAILHSGSLGFIYHGIAKCPLPVLRWLFQLMSLNPDASRDAFQTLWNISTYQNISSAVL
ncbi:hypothetical protein NXF25_014601 [Crotalus adamanteus]|uniref:Coiled-coil SMC6 And NSE5 INteracting (CANIN) domain-containing protein n=1 Tax=Crotalus adamanteus TaxID=8729 RepID=A0AAW1AZ66_CROAD